MKVLNIVIAGVGGQGNVLACQIIGMAAVEEGWQVSAADTFGVSQRGGAVMSHLRLAQGRTCGPLLSSGEADLVLGLEPLETVRVLRKYGNKKTRVIVNTRPNYPLAVLSGVAEYPGVSSLLEAITAHTAAVFQVPADRLAREAGSLLAQNVVITGAAAGSGWLPLSLATFEKVLRSLFGGKVLDINLRAFHSGVAAVTRQQELKAAAGR